MLKCCYSPRSVNHSSHSGLPKRRRTCLLGEQLQPGARIRLGFRDRATWSGEIVRSTSANAIASSVNVVISAFPKHITITVRVGWDVIVVWYSSREALQYSCSHKRGSVCILYCTQHMLLSVYLASFYLASSFVTASTTSILSSLSKNIPQLPPRLQMFRLHVVPPAHHRMNHTC